MNDDDLAALTKARSMLILLLATCQQTLLAFEAAANVLDMKLAADLKTMIARTEDELGVVADKIESLQG